MKISLFYTLAITLLFSSCATLMNDESQLIQIESNQPALVQIRNSKGKMVSKVTAPANVSLSNEEAPYEIAVSAEGYGTQTVYLRSKTTASFWGNLVLGGPIGMAIDYFTGSMWMLNNDRIEIVFDS